MQTATATDVTFACESVRDLWDELLPLMVAHHDERSAADPRLPPLKVDVRQYEIADAAGNLRVFTARSGEELVGYAVFVVGNHRLSRDLPIATHDTLYLAPAHRRGLAGAELVIHAERALAADGVRRVYQNVPHGSPVGAMFERLGYAVHETTYAKDLSHG